MNNRLFAIILKETIIDKGITQLECANLAGTTQATISRYVSGLNTPDIHIVARIAKALGVSMDYLCGLTDIPTTQEALGEEVNLLLKGYERTNQHERKIIWATLEKRMTEDELSTIAEYVDLA